MRRHQRRSTIITSKRPWEDWGKLIGNVTCATAILDRFLVRRECTRTGEWKSLPGKRSPACEPLLPRNISAITAV